MRNTGTQASRGPLNRGLGAQAVPLVVRLASVVLVCLAFSLSLAATGPYEPTIANPLGEAWRWRPFPELDGKGIRCIAETPDRRVFIGCTQGVQEYDGYDWHPHHGEGAPSGSPVEQLFVARDGSVYATNQSGIYRYFQEEWTQIFTAPEKFPFEFYALRQFSDGTLMACANRGFLFLDGTETTLFTSASRTAAMRKSLAETRFVTLPANALNEGGDLRSASDATEDAAGDIWLAITTDSERGKLLRFDFDGLRAGRLGDYEVVESNDELSLGADQKLLLAADERLWVINSSSDRGIHIYDGKNWESVYINQRFGGDEYMTDIIQTDNGIIWISTIAKIFTYSPNGEWAMYKSPQYPVPANRVLLANSAANQLWLAGYKSKLLLLDFSHRYWLTYEGLSFQVSDGPQDEWFIEQDNRVVHHDGRQWTAYGTADGLMDAPVRLIRTRSGQLWAAGSHRGKAATAVLRGDRWETRLHPTLSWGIDYRAVFEAADGALWFGGSVDARAQDGFTSGLLEVRDPEADEPEWIYHTYGENGLLQANVYGIGETPDGKIWIGGSRLLFYDGEQWQAAEDEKLQQYVNCVYSTDELLLVGSRYYGVFVFDGTEWTNYTTADGLPGNTIISMDVLPDSTILVATENGTCGFDGTSWIQDIFPDQLDLDFEGGTITHTDRYIYTDHVPRSWKRRALNASQPDPLHYAFYSTRYEPSRQSPQTSITFYTEPVAADGNGIISWTGEDYFGRTKPSELVYSFRLDGGDWSPFVRTDQYSFTNLPDGPHRLEVKSKNLDFIEDPTPAVVAFQVLPPIWKQGWFIGLILLFLTIFGVYEYRVLTKKRKLEAVNTSLQDRNEEIRLQRDQLETMLVQLENLSKAKLGFFTNISHELRTPLSLILGPITQLVDEQSTLNDGRRAQLQRIVQRNAQRLLKLIDQLLEIRRIEHVSLEIKLDDIRLSDYIAAIVELFEDLALDRDIFLTTRDSTAGYYASVDTDKVEKILANLLSNAFRHTPAGGSISVSLDEVAADAAGLNSFYDRYFQITVSDTGCGISNDKIELIFDKYYTSGTGVTKDGGTGIGLSYIKDLVYLMQGEIRVESIDGKGSTFRVFLPLIPAIEPSVPGSADMLPALRTSVQEASLLHEGFLDQSVTVAADGAGEFEQGGAERILIVEDNPDMLQFLTQLLEDTYGVVTATNGKEGLEAAEQHSFDLILSDVMMGEMDGMAFCAAIKSNLNTSHIPVILLTAKVLDENKESGYRVGADDYITKPFNPDLLIVRVKNLLAQRQRLREKFNLDFQLTPETEELTSPDEEFMNRLAGLLQDNVSESDFNVKAMCDAMHLSHMHFIRKVKQLTGKKPIDLLKSYRMKMARELLAQDSLTVAEVAYRVGFDLPNSFSRTFKKEFDMTPTQYVRSIREEEEV